MPLDPITPEQENFYRRWQVKRAVNWRLKFVWWPKKCKLTGQRLWLEKAYCGQVMWATDIGFTMPIFVKRDQFLIWALTNSHKTSEDYFRNEV